MSHLTFDLFKETVIEGIKDYMSADFANFTVDIREVVKNNDRVFTGLTLRNPEESGKASVSPTLYLEDFFKEYEGGKSADEILGQMAEIYEGAYNEGIRENYAELADSMMDFQSVTEQIVPHLVNSAFNKERLKNIPFATVADLSIIFYVEISDDASVCVSNEMLSRWDISEEELLSTALSNLYKRDNLVVKSMADTLVELMIPDYEDLSEEEKEEALGEARLPEDDGSMYVLSTKNKHYGAIAVLNPDFMKKVAEKIGSSSFFILPSSVHELICVPDRTGAELATLEQMVKEVNSTEVPPQDILSDSVYRYDFEKKEIYVAKAEDEDNRLKEQESNESEAVIA